MVGSTRDEVLGKAAEHASAVHGVTVTPELPTQVLALIRDRHASDADGS